MQNRAQVIDWVPRVCGEGELVKIFLIEGQVPTGTEIN